jgi:deazaflavin-dependent oxidoreductase (nitroreductase family)
LDYDRDVAPDRKSALLYARSVVHRAVFSATDGRLLGRWGGLPVVLLTTTGRKTGRPRPTILVSPVRNGDRVVVVASNGGAARHPDWYLNLRDHPEAEVVLGGRRRRVTARTATPEEKASLWTRITARAPAYARYQERTDRDIPVVVLEPAHDPPR